MVMRAALAYLLLSLLMAWPGQSPAQTRSVDPADLRLNVFFEDMPATPFRQEMILLTIHGVYKRHITREKLVQPDFAGFSWMQLGEDYWYESMIDGLPVKNMRRRMAIFPDDSGTLEIGEFQHILTLLDEQNKWFEHTIASEPLKIDVAPEPVQDHWWFPVRGLTVSDDWSNAPDQLKEGEGVLRVVRLSALGASPDMLPPMPELRSPSALIFPHPEKRLVELTPDGPRAVSFWRWTVTPTNGRSALLEPLEFAYFDTQHRKDRKVTISVQRVAFGDVVNAETERPEPVQASAQPNPGLNLVVVLLGFGASLLLLLRQSAPSVAPLQSWITRTRLRRHLQHAARTGDVSHVRRTAHCLDQLYLPDTKRQNMLTDLDSALFGTSPESFDARSFVHQFLARLKHPRPHDKRTKNALATRLS